MADKDSTRFVINKTDKEKKSTVSARGSAIKSISGDDSLWKVSYLLEMRVEEIVMWGKKGKKNRRISLLDDYRSFSLSHNNK